MQQLDLFSYLVTCIIAAGTPGPGTLSVIVYSGMFGWRKAIPVILGIQIGMFAMAVLALSGVTAIITASPLLFSILQYIGAIYIAYLGIMSLLASRKNSQINMVAQDKGHLKNAYHGAIVTFASPKTLLFFTSFFPLFINPEKNIFSQNVNLLIILLACTLCVHIVYCAFMQKMQLILHKYQNLFFLFVGLAFLSLALYMGYTVV